MRAIAKNTYVSFQGWRLNLRGILWLELIVLAFAEQNFNCCGNRLYCIPARNIFAIETMAELLKCSECGELFDDPTKAKKHANSVRGRCGKSGAVLQPVSISVRASDRIAGGREKRIDGSGISAVPVDAGQNYDHPIISENDFYDCPIGNPNLCGLLDDDDNDVVEGCCYLWVCAKLFFFNFIVIVMYCYCYVLLSLCIVIVIILLLFYNIVLYSGILCHCILTMRVKIQAKWQIMKKSGHTIFPKWGFMKKSGPTIKQL